MNFFITRVSRSLFNFISIIISGGCFFSNQWFGLRLRVTISNNTSIRYIVLLNLWWWYYTLTSHLTCLVFRDYYSPSFVISCSSVNMNNHILSMNRLPSSKIKNKIKIVIIAKAFPNYCFRNDINFLLFFLFLIHPDSFWKNKNLHIWCTLELEVVIILIEVVMMQLRAAVGAVVGKLLSNFRKMILLSIR